MEGGIGSAEPLATELLRRLPDDRKLAQGVNFDQEYAAVVGLLLERYSKRLQLAFDEVIAPATDKGAIARLLFNLCPLEAEIALSQNPGSKDAALLQGTAPGSALYQDRLLGTEAYRNAARRVQVVTGLKAVAEAVTEQAQLMQQMAHDLSRELVAERLEFVGAHGVVLQAVLERATRAEADATVLAREKQALAEQKVLVGKRKTDVDTYKEDLAAAQARVAAEMKRLEAMTQKLFDLRILLRDTRVKNSEGEKKVRELEARIKELESK